MPADWDYWQLEEEPPVDPADQAAYDREFDQIPEPHGESGPTEQK